jgi:hypothetical protein
LKWGGVNAGIEEKSRDHNVTVEMQRSNKTQAPQGSHIDWSGYQTILSFYHEMPHMPHPWMAAHVILHLTMIIFGPSSCNRTTSRGPDQSIMAKQPSYP